MMWLQNPGAVAMGRTLLHSLWEGAAIGLVLMLMLSLARSARVRYAAACVAMLAMLGGLVITFAIVAPKDVRIQMERSGPMSLIASGSFALPADLGNGPPSIDLRAWLAALWIAGVLIFQLRAITSWMAARRLRRAGVCCAAAEWQECLDRLRLRLRLSRSVALLESCLAEVPVVIGYLRPVILMPVGLLAGLPVTQVEAILLHELAHIRRYDYLVNLLQVIVEGVLFYHPVVWWISGVVRTERENCCDDLVVSVTGGALEYATALTALEQRRGDAGMAMASTGGNLVKRIQRLLGRTERPEAMAMPIVSAAILTVTVVSAMAALQFSPAQTRVRPHVQPKPEDRVILMAQAQPARPAPPRVAPPDQILYERAIQQIQLGSYSIARMTLNTLISTYPSGEYARKAKLAIADSWSREGDEHGKAQAVAEYRDFIMFYPNTEEAKIAEAKLGLLAPYKKWMDEDAAYIISDQERKAFVQLQDDPEREKFVEQFWLRRDPTPGTDENEFKSEYYRRIAYANEHYAGSIPGWKTDRGRMYIQFGPPDEIESHPAGGSYQRPAAQGGGKTEVFPFEQWRYKYIDGIGNNIIMEFVDRAGNGEYKMTMDPTEKDALQHLMSNPPALSK